jgi:hypothetical protein
MTTPTPDPPAAVTTGELTRRTTIRRELVYFGIVGGFGIVVLPLLVYLAGAATLGPYEGGLLRFLGKLYGDFLTLSPAAATLLLGPYLLFQAVRLLTRPLRHRGRTASSDR